MYQDKQHAWILLNGEISFFKPYLAKNLNHHPNSNVRTHSRIVEVWNFEKKRKLTSDSVFFLLKTFFFLLFLHLHPFFFIRSKIGFHFKKKIFFVPSSKKLILIFFLHVTPSEENFNQKILWSKKLNVVCLAFWVIFYKVTNERSHICKGTWYFDIQCYL